MPVRACTRIFRATISGSSTRVYVCVAYERAEIRTITQAQLLQRLRLRHHCHHHYLSLPTIRHGCHWNPAPPARIPCCACFCTASVCAKDRHCIIRFVHSGLQRSGGCHRYVPDHLKVCISVSIPHVTSFARLLAHLPITCMCVRVQRENA